MDRDERCPNPQSHPDVPSDVAYAMETSVDTLTRPPVLRRGHLQASFPSPAEGLTVIPSRGAPSGGHSTKVSLWATWRTSLFGESMLWRPKGEERSRPVSRGRRRHGVLPSPWVTLARPSLVSSLHREVPHVQFWGLSLLQLPAPRQRLALSWLKFHLIAGGSHTMSPALASPEVPAYLPTCLHRFHPDANSISQLQSL